MNDGPLSELRRKYIFLELTNHCNFSCTFCPDGIMTRPRRFMSKELAVRLIGEIASKKLTSEPLQLHLMGEPLLHPHLFEIIDAIHSQGLPVRLFTNGSLLNPANRKKIFSAGIKELVIGIHTPNDRLYREHRRGKPEFKTYMAGIEATIEDRFKLGITTRIILQYLNTLHFNRSRLAKGYHRSVIPLIDTHEKALDVIESWKAFGRTISAEYNLGHEPVDLECLRGRYRTEPLECLKGDHVEILPGVILSFKDISGFSDFLYQDVRYVERYSASCSSFDEQLAVLADGRCTPCCVDYDGRLHVGDAGTGSLESVLGSETLRGMRESAHQELLPTPTCRICKSILVQDDYDLKFGRIEYAYDLDFGWYELEGERPARFRWTGKRAALTLHETHKAAALTCRVRNSHPHLERMEVTLVQGRRSQAYTLYDRKWTDLRFDLDPGEKENRRIICESEIFWIPAMVLENNDDRRELGIQVQDVLLD